jgi:hypothetical protein
MYEQSHDMSGYLELARQVRARQNEPGLRPASEAATDVQTVRQSRPVHFDPEGRKLEAAGFKPKERGGKVIWQRPDTGFWVSQEMALDLVERKSMEEGQKA